MRHLDTTPVKGRTRKLKTVRKSNEPFRHLTRSGERRQLHNGEATFALSGSKQCVNLETILRIACEMVMLAGPAVR